MGVLLGTFQEHADHPQHSHNSGEYFQGTQRPTHKDRHCIKWLAKGGEGGGVPECLLGRKNALCPASEDDPGSSPVRWDGSMFDELVVGVVCLCNVIKHQI